MNSEQLMCLCRNIFALFFLISQIVHVSSVAINNNETILSKQNGELLTDMRWFFNGLETFSETIEDMLPKLNATEGQRELTETNKFNFLMSIRHFFGGLKEVSRNIRQTFTEEHIRQLEQLKGASDFVHEQLGYLKMWLGNFRAWITNLFRLYNYYVPEVLLSKCATKYMRNAHPDSAFYEYPLLLINDIFDYYLKVIEEGQEEAAAAGKINANQTISMQQNEIINAEDRNDNNQKADFNATHVESFFTLREYFQTDKNEIIDNAAKIHSWQNCLKMYAVETVARQIKTFFLEI